MVGSVSLSIYQIFTTAKVCCRSRCERYKLPEGSNENKLSPRVVTSNIRLVYTSVTRTWNQINFSIPIDYQSMTVIGALLLSILVIELSLSLSPSERAGESTSTQHLPSYWEYLYRT